MRCLQRNKTKFFYALYAGKVALLDEDGNKTGEYGLSYENPVEVMFNVSAARGETVARQFGEDVGYDRVIVLDDLACPIDEHTILWIDKFPKIEPDGSTKTPHDHEVRKVARSINSISLAVSKVNVQ